MKILTEAAEHVDGFGDLEPFLLDLAVKAEPAALAAVVKP